MRHRVKGQKLNRDSGHRKALRMNLASELLEHGRIKTTISKAKFIRGHVEKIITVAKRGLAKAEAEGRDEIAVHARRIVASRLNNNRELVQKLFDDIAPSFKERPGGYTRIYKLGPRKGDNADMAIIELVSSDEDDE